MNYKVLVTRNFEKELKRLVKKYPSLKVEFVNLVNNISKGPFSGIKLTNNCYKYRISIASKNKGKRAGGRVISHVYFEKDIIYLLSIYDKSEKSSLFESEIKNLIENIIF